MQLWSRKDNMRLGREIADINVRRGNAVALGDAETVARDNTRIVRRQDVLRHRVRRGDGQALAVLASNLVPED
ncbi:hypothetical protein [Candidatus Frankia alpina]|uniref:hypothetical protein n=1 Tax=Candidatus Frankia alpina TaxID=2699483 RepID=UPI0013D11D51|nr:hypothetical protein [Candidatus Frankia alpina]